MRDEDMRLSARDKVVQKMSRDGAVENNISADTSKRVSNRIADATLKDTPASELQLGGRATHGDTDLVKRGSRYSGYLKKIREGNGGASENMASNTDGVVGGSAYKNAMDGNTAADGNSYENGGDTDGIQDSSYGGISQGNVRKPAGMRSSGGGSGWAAVDGSYNLKPDRGRLRDSTGQPKADSRLQEKGGSLKQKKRLKKKQVRLQYEDSGAGSGSHVTDGRNHTTYDGISNASMEKGSPKSAASAKKKKRSRLRFDDELLQDAGNGKSGRKTAKPAGVGGAAAYGGMNAAKDIVSNAAHTSDVGDGKDDNFGSEALKEGASLADRSVLRHGRAGGNTSVITETDKGNGARASSLRYEPQDKKSSLRFREDGRDSVAKPDAAKRAEAKSKNKVVQKKRIKKEYAAAFKNRNGGTSKAATEAVKGTADKAKKAVTDFAKRHPAVIAVGAAVGLLSIVAVSTAGTFGALVSEMGSAVTESTYLSSDDNILAANDAYTDMEEELQDQVDHIERDYPGYDEYRYQVDEITHDPYALTSYLTSMYGNYKYEDIKENLKTLFQDQFHLKLTDEVETRTRTVTNDDGTTSEEEYEVTILNVKVTNKGLDNIAMASLGTNQQKLYGIYQASLGNRSYLFGDSITIGNPVDGGMGYEIPREALDDAEFANMIQEAEKYLGMAYVWGGYSPTGGFDCSGFVSYVINHCGNGWNVGRLTANGLRGICAPVSSSEAKPGDLIFFQGTYNTSGASHVGIYVGNGMMIHCGNPIQYTSVNSNYWQQHFLSYGRIGE